MTDPKDILDLPIVFVEPAAFQTPGRNRGWDYSLDGIVFVKPFTPVKEKWIYAFAVKRMKGNAVEFVAELEATKDGTFRRNKCPNRPAVNPANANDFAAPTKAVKLDTKVAGDSLLYFFIVSRVRLSAKAIRDLAAFRWAGLDNFQRGFVDKVGERLRIPVWDLTTSEHFVGTQDGHWLPVLDYLSLGEYLGKKYRQALDRYDSASDPDYYPEGSDERRNLEDKLLRYCLASTIRRLAKGDEEVARKIGKPKELLEDSRDFEKHVGELRLEVERWATKVCGWFQSPALAMADTWYQHHEVDKEAEFITTVGSIHDRLEESIAGIHSLKEPGPQLEEILERIVFPTQKALFDAKKTYGVMKKAVAPVASLWSKFIPWYLPIEAARRETKTIDEAFRKMVEHINHGFDRPLLDVYIAKPVAWNFGTKEAAAGLNNNDQRRAFRLLRAPGSQAELRTMQSKALAIREIEFLENSRVGVIEAEAKAAGKNKEFWGGKSIPWIFRVVDAVNSGWKVYAFHHCDRRTVYDYIDCVGGVSSFVKNVLLEGGEDVLAAVNKGRKLAGKSALVAPRMVGLAKRCLGVLGTIADLASAYKDFSKAVADGDLDARNAILVAGGAALVGGVAALVAAAPALLILICATTQGVASFYAYMLRDTRVALLVEHSIYGTNFGKSDAAPIWSPTKFCEWRSDRVGLLNQINAFEGLIVRFSIGTVRAGMVSFDIVGHTSGSVLTVIYADRLLGEEKIHRHVARISLDDPGEVERAGDLAPMLLVRPKAGRANSTSLSISYREGGAARQIGAAFVRAYLTMSISSARGRSVMVKIPAKEYRLNQTPSGFELPVIEAVGMGADGKARESDGTWHAVVQSGRGSGRGQIYVSSSSTSSVPE